MGCRSCAPSVVARNAWFPTDHALSNADSLSLDGKSHMALATAHHEQDETRRLSDRYIVVAITTSNRKYDTVPVTRYDYIHTAKIKPSRDTETRDLKIGDNKQYAAHTV